MHTQTHSFPEWTYSYHLKGTSCFQRKWRMAIVLHLENEFLPLYPNPYPQQTVGIRVALHMKVSKTVPPSSSSRQFISKWMIPQCIPFSVPLASTCNYREGITKRTSPCWFSSSFGDIRKTDGKQVKSEEQKGKNRSNLLLPRHKIFPGDVYLKSVVVGNYKIIFQGVTEENVAEENVCNHTLWNDHVIFKKLSWIRVSC